MIDSYPQPDPERDPQREEHAWEPLVYDELRALAAALLRHERPDHTLQPTALVNEAWLKLCAGANRGWQDRGHFFAVASRAMRQILVDHARGRGRQKRGGGWLRVTLSETPAPTPTGEREIDILALDEALTELESFDLRKCRVVELRFFGGLTNLEASDVLGVSHKTTEADWYMARAWLRKRLSETE